MPKTAAGGSWSTAPCNIGCAHACVQLLKNTTFFRVLKTAERSTLYVTVIHNINVEYSTSIYTAY